MRGPPADPAQAMSHPASRAASGRWRSQTLGVPSAYLQLPELLLKKHSVSLLLLGMAITLYFIGLTLPASGLIIIAMVVESHLWVRLTSRSRRNIHHH